MSEDDAPSLSVVVPVRNDAAHLGDTVAVILRQDYPRPFELVLAVGPSADGTREVAEELQATHSRVRVVDNPTGTTPAALNAAIRASTGDVIARVDSHSEPAPGYLRHAVEQLEATGADNVGGVQRATGATPVQDAIAAAMSSPFGVGNARFHYGGRPGPTDTVYLGVFRRSALERIGGYDESLVRNQDYDLNWRIRDSGGTVWFDPELVVTYHPRATWLALARQYWQYGYWKAVMLGRHPRSLRWRQLAAPLAVVANATALATSVVWPQALVVPASYGLGCAVAAMAISAPAGVRLRLPLTFALMHHAWGGGFLTSLASRRRHPAPSVHRLTEDV